MNELSLQSDVVKAVIGAGGFAFKMSHKFKVGVADLFVKLPGLPAAFFEVKYCGAPKTLDYVSVDPTPLQSKFLRDAAKADMEVGLISFVKRGSTLGVRVFSGETEPRTAFLSSYSWVKLAYRKELILRLLEGED